MGRRGPAPKPSALRKLDGQPVVRGEAKPRPVRPVCPEYLDEIAQGEWERVVPELERIGLLSCVDGAALEGYCISYSLAVRAAKKLGKGMTFKTQTGYMAQRPEVAILNNALKQVRAFCAEFGLSPAGRARMAIPGEAEADDPMEKLLTKKLKDDL
jgi:P27 family predicted phage terminase small subunit